MKSKDALKFVPFDRQSLEATRREWEDSLTRSDGPLHTQTQFFERLKASIVADEAGTKAESQVAAYGVFEKVPKNIAIAICELIVTRRNKHSKWIKMLDLFLDPKIEDGIFQNKADETEQALDIYVRCITGVFEVQSVYKADTVKVYGRTTDQFKMLILLNSALQIARAKHKLSATMEGRWLVVRDKI